MVIIIYGRPQRLIFKVIAKTTRKKLIMSRSRRFFNYWSHFYIIMRLSFNIPNENFKTIGVKNSYFIKDFDLIMPINGKISKNFKAAQMLCNAFIKYIPMQCSNNESYIYNVWHKDFWPHHALVGKISKNFKVAH